jgi:hypothetical protein
MINIAVDKAQMTKLQAKFQKYGPYAISKGLAASNDYLNSPDIRAGMYPPKSSEPFVWSSDRQRRAYFATNGFGGGIPYSRTMQLYEGAKFQVNERSFWIEYVNGVPYAKWVQHPSYQIIGMKARHWLYVNTYISKLTPEVVRRFKPAVLKAWEDLDSFMYSGGVGL